MTSLDFQQFLTAAAQEKVLIPAVHAALYDPHFAGFTVPVQAWSARSYDGWFHPSRHATWTVRQLYLYLTAGQLLQEERMPLTGVLAVTAGKFWHEFLQRLWLADGTLLRAEVPIVDVTTNRLGHADGLLASGEGLEIKTINEFQISKAVDEQFIKTKKYDYWCQTQDYLDCMGWDAMRYFLISPSFPYPMTEFVVPADKAYQAKRRSEYLHALELADRYPNYQVLEDLQQSAVPTCCAPGSPTAKKCPTWNSCPIGRFGQ